MLMDRIGNTADCWVSGLDEGQAAGLLSAVGGNGLSLVEPGATTDPVATGLDYAMNRAYHAWIATQPQLILDLWDDVGLDEPHPSAVRFVEPAALSGAAAPRGGLNTGAEPRHAPHADPARVAPSATPNADGSAPLKNDGPDATTSMVAHRGQKGA